LSTLVTGDASDPLHLGTAVAAEIGGRVGRARLVAEVDAARELAHHQQVGAFDDLSPQRAGVVERRQRAHGPQVRVQAQALAQAEQALLGPWRIGIRGVPLRAADRGQQDRVGALAGGQDGVGQRGAVGVDRGAAERVLFVAEVADGVEDRQGGREDLGADPVAGQGDDAVGHGGGPYWPAAAMDRRGPP
jgi:hypothetical protein